MKNLAFSFLALLISGCISTGLNEPDVYICTINVNDDSTDFVGDCVNTKTGRYFKKEIIDMIGDQCVNPIGFAEIKTHHQILHDELNKRKR